MTSRGRDDLNVSGKESDTTSSCRDDTVLRSTVATLAISLTESLPALVAPPRNKTTDISKEFRRCNTATVNSIASADNSILTFSRRTGEKLQLCHRDIITVTSKHKETILVGFIDDSLNDGCVHMNCVARENLGVNIGDTVTVDQCSEVRYLKRVVVIPTVNTFGASNISLFELFLGPYFHEQFRPLGQDDVFRCSAGQKMAQFRVTEVYPPKHGVVAQDTVIHCDTARLLPDGSSFKMPRFGGGVFAFWASPLHSVGRNANIGRKLRKDFQEKRLTRWRSFSSSTEALLAKT